MLVRRHARRRPPPAAAGRRWASYPPAGLKGNGVVGIRREDKNAWERRVPLTPSHVRQLTKNGLQVVVQPSSIRAFSNEEYEEAGADISEDLSVASTILAVKEVPTKLLIPERTYMMFSHTHKAQPYNMPLLDTLLAKRIRLIDFERIAGPDGRVVKFGPFAGFAGTIDTLHALGFALLTRHNAATPFLHLSLSKEYRSLEAARQDLRIAGDVIRTRGLPKEVCPLTFVITGNGSVSQAAQQILHHLPCQYVDSTELQKIWQRGTVDNKCIYVCVAGARDMVSPKDPGAAFDKADYYNDPSAYVPTFHERVLPYARVIINGMYWEEKFPRLVTNEQARRLHREGRFPLLALGEITCDPYGSIEFFSKSTSIAHPIYAYDPESDEPVEFTDYDGRGPLIVGVDHLPAEFPSESSQFFGDPLAPLVQKVATSDGTLPLAQQQEQLPPEVMAGVICAHGELTPSYSYISDLRRRKETATGQRDKRRVVFLGAGMVSGPAVRHVLSDPRNSVTIADQDVAKAEQVLKDFAGNAAKVGRDAAGRLQDARAVSLDITNPENLDSLVRDADLVVSLVPWTMHPIVMERCIELGRHLVTASYVTPETQKFHERAEKAGLTFLNEMGLDPGIDIMSTLQMLDKIRMSGGVVKSYQSFCGALPEPESARNSLGYKFSWSPRGVLLAAQRPSRFRWHGKEIALEGKYLYDIAQPFTPFRGLNMEWVPNGDAMGYASVYGFGDETETIVRATLRYGGFAQAVKAMRELGLVDAGLRNDAVAAQGSKHASWPSLLAAGAGAPAGATAQELGSSILPQHLAGALQKRRAEVQELCDGPLKGFYDPSHQPALDAEVTAGMAALRELRLLDEAHMAPKTPSGEVIDSLAAALMRDLHYLSHERDFVLMFHRFEVEYSKGTRKVHESRLAKRGTSRASATAVTVGLPVGIAANLILDGSITRTGIVRPITKDVYDPIMHVLRENGVHVYEDEYDP